MYLNKQIGRLHYLISMQQLVKITFILYKKTILPVL
jgi:hypothetical protein